eukprot:3233985-Alexandrium_andersonii.AAC.1
MSDVGEPEMPEMSTDDFDEEMSFLMHLMEMEGVEPQEGSESPSVRTSSDPRDAPDLIRALFAAGATPGEVRASVTE